MQKFDKQELRWKLFLQTFKDFEETPLSKPKIKERLANELYDLFYENRKWIIKDDDKYFFYKDCYNKFKEWLERFSLLLKNTTKEFVTKNFPGVKDISFYNKNNGNQIGTICHMHFEDGSFKKLYVKTHQFGPTASMSKSSKSPDVKELLVYKILENIGLGPKSYFFWPENVSVKTLFIATEGLDLTFYNPNQ
ncbi:hypothetical protein HDV02_003385 [Globomyces sp. JEL0801]|nr:hypothetical protein HDV02_003385 [Globomyces sp. JEL0801]